MSRYHNHALLLWKVSITLHIHNYTSLYFPRRLMVTKTLCSVYHNKKRASALPFISPEPLTVLVHYVKASGGFSTRTYVHHAVLRVLRLSAAFCAFKVYSLAHGRFCPLCAVCNRRRVSFPLLSVFPIWIYAVVRLSVVLSVYAACLSVVVRSVCPCRIKAVVLSVAVFSYVGGCLSCAVRLVAFLW